jgi:CBS domain-containing protein
MSLLLQVPISDLTNTKKSLVDVSAAAPIREALVLLEDHGLLSLPVFGRAGSWAGAGGVDVIVGEKQFIGIVSILDIIMFTMGQCPELDEASLVAALEQPVSSAIGSTDESLSLWVESPEKDLVSSPFQLI